MPSSREKNSAIARNAGLKEVSDSHRWTFLTNHAHVLILLHENSELVLREVAAKVGITERAVQRIIQDLEEGGFLEREKIGRRNHYRVRTTNYLRHPVESHCKISDLLNLVASKRKTIKADKH